MASIQRMVELVNRRTGDEVGTLRDRTQVLIAIQLSLLALMVVLGVASFAVANRRVVRPLRRLTRASAEIAGGDYGQRVDIDALQELEELGERFNTMGEAIEGDIARREAAEAEAVQARAVAEAADSAKSHFLATMSHEIRTPLNAVLGMSEILRDSPLDADQRDCVDTISTSGDHLLGVINDILDFSKIESGMLELDPEIFELRACVEDALDLTAGRAAEKGLDLVVDIAPGTPDMIRADRGRVRQVLVNYLANAIKFTERGEVVARVSVAAYGLFELRVSDTGIGIPPDRLDRLFRSFSQVDASTTRQYGGTGLGLAICKRLAELMGGEVGVESEPGVGSTFSFSFRAETDPTWTAPQRPDAAELVGRSVLIVDDNQTNRRILRVTAEGWGMRVVDVESAALALQRLDEGFDLAVLDHLMPGMDGLELAAAVTQRLGERHPPLLLLSSDRRTSRTTAGVDLVMTKPARRAALLDAFLQLVSAEPVRRGTRTAARSQVAEPAALSASPLKILLAEDNLANQKVAQRMLSSLGYAADIVDTGVAAVAAVEREHYDVVLMDVHMPEMDGLEATRRIRALPEERQPRIFAMTASALDSERQACLDAGMERHIPKPVSRLGLEEALSGVDASEAEAPAADEPGGLALDALAESISAEGVVEMIDAIAGEAGDAVASLHASVAGGDADALRRRAHTMKSNTAMVGALGLSDLCQRVELLAKDGDMAAAAPLVDQLAHEYEACVEQLTAARAQYA